MAICTHCKASKAQMFSSLCATCLNDPETLKSLTASAAQLAPKPMSEGATAAAIGRYLIGLSLVAAMLLLWLALRGADTRPGLIVASIVAGLVGMFFGYLLEKVGSVLMHLEREGKPEEGAAGPG
jgi:hypothetical protein